VKSPAEGVQSPPPDCWPSNKHGQQRRTGVSAAHALQVHFSLDVKRSISVRSAGMGACRIMVISRRVFRVVCRMVLISSLWYSSSAVASEKKVKHSDLPAAVQNTVASHSQGATVRGFSEETENGETYYEAELLVDGHSKDLLVDRSGAIVEVEEQVAMDALPAAVRAGLEAKAGKGKLVKVESITKHDKLVAYEAKVMRDGMKSEIQVGPDGRALDHEE
jgi:hypothetical protein